MSVISELRELSQGDFMQPQAFFGYEMESELMHAGLDTEPDKVYCRLSANGYMDCTDWSGPYDDIEHAAQSLIDMFYSD